VPLGAWFGFFGFFHFYFFILPLFYYAGGCYTSVYQMNQDTLPPGSNPSITPRADLPAPGGTDRPPKPFRKKWLSAVVVVLIIALAGAVYVLRPDKGQPQVNKASQKPAAVSAHPDRIRLIATGDFIAHDSLNSQAKQADGSYNYLQFMSDFKPIFAGADIRFCNQATISAGSDFGISGYPVFNAPTQFAKDMAGLGCNLVNTASNHSFDKGQAAIDATVGVWAGLPGLLGVAGENRSAAEQNAVHYFEIKGVKFAFLAYTTYSNSAPTNNYGVNVFSRDFAASQIAAAKQAGAKFIITSMRWGTEYSPTVNSQQTADSQFLADQGVSLIIGHGPHQLQTLSRLRGSGGNQTLVWYSLGNFINTQEPPETLFNGIAVMDIDKKTQTITGISYLPIYMHYEWTPAQKTADDLAARTNLHLYLLQDANQSLIDKNQLQTTAAAQKDRIQKLLNISVSVPIIDKNAYDQ
jgi:poly-gamma-glutamate capsule biosynthesis protein CapA/YwtB (metallophosphatase superfamily)